MEGEGVPKDVTISASVLSDLVCGLYLVGVTRKLWDDAEQFLERLETATVEPGGDLARDVRETLRYLDVFPEVHGWSLANNTQEVWNRHKTQLSPALMHSEAVRYVAGACTAFLLRAEQNPRIVDESEQWDPYRRWFKMLHPGHDTVVSFNYDRVPDLLADHGRRLQRRDLFMSPFVDGKTVEGLAPNAVPLYQLHGHVSWRRRSSDMTVELESARRAPDKSIAHLHPDEAVIGIPGQTKLGMPSGLLKCLWEPAKAALRSADAIVFVGYRFPETDNLAKRTLLDAVKANREDAYVHIVLGATNADTPRVQAMLEWTRPKNRVRVHPLWAEDFLAAYERNGLFNG